MLQAPRPYVLVLLNQAVEDRALLARLWNTAAYSYRFPHRHGASGHLGFPGWPAGEAQFIWTYLG